jgi:uncharacterized protein YcbX
MESAALGMTDITATVASLHRYPVKSMLGETLETLDVDERGVVGDRQWSVRTADDKIGSGKSTGRFHAVVGLLDVRAAIRDGRVMVTLPDDADYAVEDPAAAERLSSRLGQPLTFARETDVSHYDDGPVSLIGRASIGALAHARGDDVDATRFRANVVLDTDIPYVEDSWVGGRVVIGTAVFQVVMPSPRCVMINMASADLAAQPGNLATLAHLHDSCLGVIARVVTPGRITIGDTISVL